ncbi:MAG: heliorhodopsin HeR [Halanaerobiales bacterium]|nr:heliorhodopsin HeR [Halanaerobiales bacterium]
MNSSIKFKGLKRFNIIVGFIHLIQAILMVWLSTDFIITVNSTYMMGPPGTTKMGTEAMFDIRLGLFVALFMFLSSIAHFAVSTFAYQWYLNNLKNNINRARWIEYSLSSSLMIIIIAMLVGITDLGVLVLLFIVNASMIFFGWMMELYNQKTKKVVWTPFIFGCIAGIAPWITIFIRLITAVNKSPVGVPAFVIGIFVSLFVFFNIFAINQLLQYKKVGPWEDYLYGEKVYIILSLVAKSALAWQVFSGTLM